MSDGRKKNLSNLKYLSLITQFGLSLATPPILCIFFALWLQKKFGVGDWAVICAIAVGLISSACTFFDFIKKAVKSNNKNGGDKNEKN